MFLLYRDIGIHGRQQVPGVLTTLPNTQSMSSRARTLHTGIARSLIFKNCTPPSLSACLEAAHTTQTDTQRAFSCIASAPAANSTTFQKYNAITHLSPPFLPCCTEKNSLITSTPYNVHNIHVVAYVLNRLPHPFLREHTLDPHTTRCAVPPQPDRFPYTDQFILGQAFYNRHWPSLVRLLTTA